MMIFCINVNPACNWSYKEIQKQLSKNLKYIESDRLDCVNDAWLSGYEIFLRHNINDEPKNIKTLTNRKLLKIHNIMNLILSGEFGNYFDD